MAVYFVGFDLIKEGTNYQTKHTKLINQITTVYPDSVRIVDSAWLVDTVSNTATIRDTLARVLDNNDNLVVLGIQKNVGAWLGLSKEANNWLHSHLQ